MGVHDVAAVEASSLQCTVIEHGNKNKAATGAGEAAVSTGEIPVSCKDNVPALELTTSKEALVLPIKDAPHMENVHPSMNAGCPSIVSVAWMTPLVWLANKKPLREEEVWAPPDGHLPETTAARFLRAWEAELALARRRGRKPSIPRTVFHAFRAPMVQAGLALFLFMIFQLMQPFLIRRLLQYLSSDDSTLSGVMIAVAMLVVAISSSFFVCNYMRISKETGVMIKTAIMSVVYSHSMELSSAARLATSMGQTTNLMAVDAEKLFLACPALHFVWMTPTMTMFVGAALTLTIGTSAIAGWSLIFALWPIQQLLAKRGGLARKKAMEFTDERVKFTTEVIQGIRVAKFCAWEQAVFDRATKSRLQEVRWLSCSLFFKAIVREGILLLIPPVVLTIIFAVEHWRGRQVEAVTALTALGFLNVLRFPLNLFAMSLATTQDALVSCRRLSEFLQREVLARETLSNGPEDALVDMCDVAFTWAAVGADASTATFRLVVNKLTLSGLTRAAVIGRVAAGKSSLLAALLGEMQQICGTSLLRGSVAYMGQKPWVQNMSLRSNILFGHEFEECTYWQVVSAAALEPDLAILRDADLTEIGERGINLSGGQKARVCLARCLYAVAIGACNVLILDCPFDALDIPTGQKVFEGVMMLASKALMICSMSAQINLLPNFDQIIVIEGGQVAMMDDFTSVSKQYPELVGSGQQSLGCEALGGIESVTQDALLKGNKGMVNANKGSRILRKDTTLMRKDIAKTGGIGLYVLLKQLGGVLDGGPLAGIIVGASLLVIFLGGQGLRVASDVTVTEWASDEAETHLVLSLLVACATMLAMRILGTTIVSHRAATALHRKVFMRVLRAPVPEFFDVTTTGEIVNKFAKDLEVVDTLLPENAMQWNSNMTQLMVIFTLAACAIPWFLIVLLFMLAMFMFVSQKFSAVSRDLKRLDGSTRSPVYNSFSETLSGLETIRAWGVQRRFLAEHTKRTRHNLRFFHAVTMSEVWVMSRLEAITVCIISGFAFSAIATRDDVEPKLVGLALVYAIQLTALFQRTCQLTIMVKQQLTACERVRSLEGVAQEPSLMSLGDKTLPSSWPCGEIDFKDVQMRYRDGDLVLRGITFKARAGERIGICGRTGAGKSSLLSVLFRIVDPCNGTIMIDGVDIQHLGLQTLRASLSIIPQEPVIFSGTIRTNLDPFGSIKADDPLIDSMHRVGLTELLQTIGLDGPVAEQGGNLSHGQRQLLCIARVMVKRARITVLDEATSAMDSETDVSVQNALAAHWQSVGSLGAATMLTIAHRLSTILDYDKILVLSFGEVAEFDAPEILQANPQSQLSQMLRDASTDVCG